MVIKLDIKTNIMANNKTITIEHIIAKLDNDFNPDGSDWIPRVPAWCVDAMNELKVLRKVDKKMKLTVINKIAKSKCCLIDDGLKVYDSNGCEVPRANTSKYRCSDTESAPSSTGGQAEDESPERATNKDYLGMPDDCCPNGSRTREVIDTGKVGCNPVVYTVHNNTECSRCQHEVHSHCQTPRRGYDKSNHNYILIGGNTIELNFNDTCITVVYKDVETQYSDNYHCEIPVIPANGKLIQGLTYYCMARMLMRGYKHPVFNLSASQYGTNPFYLWESMKKDIKTSVLLDEQSDDDSGWNEFFYNFTFPK